MNEKEIIELLEDWSYYLGGVFNKTITPLALVGYEMIIANVAPRWLSISSLIIHETFSLARVWSKRVTWANIPQLKLLIRIQRTDN